MFLDTGDHLSTGDLCLLVKEKDPTLGAHRLSDVHVADFKMGVKILITPYRTRISLSTLLESPIGDR